MASVWAPGSCTRCRKRLGGSTTPKSGHKLISRGSLLLPITKWSRPVFSREWRRCSKISSRKSLLSQPDRSVQEVHHNSLLLLLQVAAGDLHLATALCLMVPFAVATLQPQELEQHFSSSPEVPLLQGSPELGSPSPGALLQAVLHQLLKQPSHLPHQVIKVPLHTLTCVLHTNYPAPAVGTG